MRRPVIPRSLKSRDAPHVNGEPMKTDEEIKEDVIRELQWDAQMSEPEAIGV